MILLWGLPGDAPLAHVRGALNRIGRPSTLLDQRAVLQTRVEPSTGTVCTPDTTFQLAAVTAAYLRPYDSRLAPAVRLAGVDSPAWRHTLAVDDALWTWADLTPALVVNRPAAMASNNSKPYQATVIRAAGFHIPETLITTDPDAARDFWREHGVVVYKSISGVRSIVSRLNPGDLQRLGRLVWCPTQFQEYISGTDYRVHVVGAQLFACEIRSRADDYRYASGQGETIDILPCALPDDCAGRCRALAAALELPVAGIDLRRTAADEWYCFEVNPSPGFSFFQRTTHQPIDDAIARLLATGRLTARSGLTPAPPGDPRQ